VPTYASTLTGAQDGFRTVFNAWNEASSFLQSNGTATDSDWFGLQFPVHTTFDSESRPLSPNLIWPSFDLTLNVRNINVGQTHTVIVYGLLEAAPDPYGISADGVLVGLRNEEPLLKTDGTAASGVVTSTGVFTISDIAPTVILPYIMSSSWNGILSLSLQINSDPMPSQMNVHSSRATDPTLGPSITTTEVPFHTGVVRGDAFGRRARSRLDHRLGYPVSSDNLVRDGYEDGLMVTPEAWDPEDPEDRYVPSPLEGVLDDET
jgi:hypothetical protein